MNQYLRTVFSQENVPFLKIAALVVSNAKLAESRLNQIPSPQTSRIIIRDTRLIRLAMIAQGRPDAAHQNGMATKANRGK